MTSQGAENIDYGKLLVEAVAVLDACVKSALTVKPSLETPYEDDPRWTPWTRWLETPTRDAFDLRERIKTAVKDRP
jgi:hypothetical protein